jgi:outer membrane PBP1 activator LpoA protein
MSLALLHPKIITYNFWRHMRLHPLFLTAIVLVAGSLSGCATKSSVAKVKDEARDAHRVAEQALTTAQEANNRSIRTEEMVNRGFRHSMRK